jgi:hypothetical protein
MGFEVDKLAHNHVHAGALSARISTESSSHFGGNKCVVSQTNERTRQVLGLVARPLGFKNKEHRHKLLACGSSALATHSQRSVWQFCPRYTLTALSVAHHHKLLACGSSALATHSQRSVWQFCPR